MSNLLGVPCLKNISADEIAEWLNWDKNDIEYEELSNYKII